jgi:uncharacterized protein YegL
MNLLLSLSVLLCGCGVVTASSSAASAWSWFFASEPEQTVGSLPLIQYVPVGGWNHHMKRTAAPGSTVVSSYSARANVDNSFATTRINATLENRAEAAVVLDFSINVNEDAFVSSLVVDVAGRRFVGRVLPRAEAAAKFAEALSQGKTAGLLQSRGTAVFGLSVTAPPKSSARFQVRFEELLSRRLGKYRYRLNVNPGQVVEQLETVIEIANTNLVRGIAWSHNGKDSALLEQPDARLARLSFRPSADYQRRQSVVGLAEDIEVMYAVADATELNAGSLVLSKPDELDGSRFFLHQFTSPDFLQPSPLTVVFVVDVSGSMGVEKMDQAKDALAFALASLRESDRFSVVKFSNDAEALSDALLPWSPANVARAQNWVKALQSGGGTNIFAGTSLAASMLTKRAPIAGDTPLCVLLTDGRDSLGEEVRVKTSSLAREGEFRLYGLAFGSDADLPLLERMAADTKGSTRRIYVGADAASQLKGFFEEIATPLLADVRVAYEPAVVRNATRSSFPTFFRGTDFVVAGLLPNGTSQFKALFSGIARGTPLTWQSTFELLPTTTGAALDVERVWAFLTIKELTQNRTIESGMSSASLNDTVRRATELSLGYGFVTEFTSLIVVAEDADVAKNMTMLNANATTRTGDDKGDDPISVAVAGGGGFRSPALAGGINSASSTIAVSAAVTFVCALAAALH